MIRGKLQAEPRTGQGKRECRTLRAQGLVPGNMYGHKEAPEMVAAKSKDVLNLLKSGVRIVDVEVGGKSTITLIREVQWDSLGDYVQHIDLVRVDPDERITVDVHIELKGTAPGVLSGGVLEYGLRTLSVECPVAAIPESIQVKAGGLEIGSVIHVKELDIPSNLTVTNNPDLVVIRVIKPQEVVISTGDTGPVQPEVIGKKADEKGDEKDSGKK